MKAVLFNHGIFEEILNNKLELLYKLYKKETDPYVQYSIKEQIRIVEVLRLDYKKTVEEQLNK